MNDLGLESICGNLTLPSSHPMPKMSESSHRWQGGPMWWAGDVDGWRQVDHPQRAHRHRRGRRSNQWSVDPYLAEVRDGLRLRARHLRYEGGPGGGVGRVRALDECGLPLRGEVFVESVISEEDGGAGALATLLRGHTADAAVITEPTNLAIVPAQGGSLVFRLTVTGLSAHAAVRNEGVSALEKFIKIHAAILEHEQRHHSAITHPLYQGFVNRAPINIRHSPFRQLAKLRTGIACCRGSGRTGPGRDPRSDQSGTDGGGQSRRPLIHGSGVHPPQLEWFSGQFAAAEGPVETHH